MPKQIYEKPLHIDMDYPKEAKEMEAVALADRVPLIEDEDTGHRFVVYMAPSGQIKADILFSGNSFWMSQAQMAETFGVERTVITKHVNNVLNEGEVEREGNVQKLHISSTKPTQVFSLQVLLAVGFRVGSPEGRRFRVWALDKLVQILTKGFYIDSKRLKGQPDHIAALRRIIQDIRSDEANVYAELRRICSICSDYDGSTAQAREFYSRMQAKLYWATVSHTGAELLRDRVDANAKNCGLQTWDGDHVLQEDVINAKNTLAGRELADLNRVTDILLSVYEDRLDTGHLTTMAEATKLLDEQLAQLKRSVLRHGGSISADDAKAHAKAQYKIFDHNRKAAEKARRDAEIAELKKIGRRAKAK